MKEKNKIFEFIVIKSLMISITNYMTELINSYLSFYQKMKKNYEKKLEEQTEENEDDDSLKSNNFGEIFSVFDQSISFRYKRLRLKSWWKSCR